MAGESYYWLAFLNRLFTQVLPSISSEFNKSNQASWLGTRSGLLPRWHIQYAIRLTGHNYSYLLSTCTFTPLYGRLCNVLGRRVANQTAVVLLAIGTLACGLSSDMSVLIAARFVCLQTSSQWLAALIANVHVSSSVEWVGVG